MNVAVFRYRFQRALERAQSATAAAARVLAASREERERARRAADETAEIGREACRGVNLSVVSLTDLDRFTNALARRASDAREREAAFGRDIRTHAAAHAVARGRSEGFVRGRTRAFDAYRLDELRRDEREVAEANVVVRAASRASISDAV